MVGYFKVEELIIIDIDADGEVEALVSFVDDLEVVELGREWGT